MTQLNKLKRALSTLLFLSLLGMMSVNAQLRIGGTIVPNQSAILDLNPDASDNAVRGLALPRVKLISTSRPDPLAGHLKGMYVYNTISTGDVVPGVYYNDGVKWVRVLGSGSITASDFAPSFYTELQTKIAQNFSSALGDTILQYINNNFDEILSKTNILKIGDTLAYYFSETTLNDTILQIIAKKGGGVANINSPGKTLIVGGSGTPNLTLDVNLAVLGDSLVKNETFITKFVNDSVFISQLYDDSHLLRLLDSVAKLIKNGGDTTLIKEIVNQISQETNIIQLGDSLAYYFSQTVLGDTIANYLLNDSAFMTQIFADTSIVKNIYNLIQQILDTMEINETTTTLINNKNGTYTYTNEVKAKSNIDVASDIYTYGDTLLTNNTFITKLGDLLVNDSVFIGQLYDDANLKQLIDSLAKLIKNGGDTTLIKEIVNQISQETNIIQLGDSLAYYFSQTVLGDTIANYLLSNNEYVTNLIDTLKSYLEDNNTLYTAGYGLNLSGTEFSANLQELTDSLTASPYINQFADSLVNNETFVTNLGNTIVNDSVFITKLFESFYDDTNILRMMDSIASLINSGADTALIQSIINQFLSDTALVNQFITQITSDSVFIKEIVNQISQETNIIQLGDSLAYYFSQTVLGDTIANYLLNDNKFIDSITKVISENIDIKETTTTLVNNKNGTYTYTNEAKATSNIDVAGDIYTYGDTLLSNSTFVNTLGDTVMKYITNNVTQALADTIISLGLPQGNPATGDTVLVWRNGKWVAGKAGGGGPVPTEFIVSGEITTDFTITNESFIKLSPVLAPITLKLPVGSPVGRIIYVSSTGQQNVLLSPLPRNPSYNNIGPGMSGALVCIGNNVWDYIGGW